MNFEFSAEEIKIHQEFAQFCQENIGREACRLDQSEKEEAPGILRKNLKKLAEQNYLGLNLPKYWGGQEKSILAALPFHEALAGACPSTYISVEASSGMAGRLLSKQGSAAQKERFLTQIVSGDCLAAFAVTEPDSGSEVLDLTTTAVKNNEGWVLNGRKSMITNAPHSDCFVVLAVTAKEAGLNGLSFFLLPRETNHLVLSEPYNKMGLRGSALGDIDLHDCQLPPEAILGNPGEGHVLYQNLMTEGSIRFAAMSIGMSRASLELALTRSNQRKVLNKPIFKNQEISFKIADIYTLLDTSLQLTRYAAWLYDQNDYQASTMASCAKLFASESVNKIVHMAQQIYGGQGYLAGNDIERLYRDARFCEIGKGTSEIHRVLIARDVFRRWI